jgi:hypothetical protein
LLVGRCASCSQFAGFRDRVVSGLNGFGDASAGGRVGFGDAGVGGGVRLVDACICVGRLPRRVIGNAGKGLVDKAAQHLPVVAFTERRFPTQFVFAALNGQTAVPMLEESGHVLEFVVQDIPGGGFVSFNRCKCDGGGSLRCGWPLSFASRASEGIGGS